MGAKRLQGIAGFVGAMACALALFSPLPAQAETPVRFSLDWRWEGSAAPFALALDRGYFKDEGLAVEIEPANGSREVLGRLASGGFDAGVADVNALIRFKDEPPNAGLKAVMMLYDRPPFAIVGRKSRGISHDLASLQGKVMGAPAADGAFANWPIFKTVNQIDDSTMTFENVGFPVREPMLAQGDVDAVFGFATSSYINLKSRGVPVEDIVVLTMSDYGVDLYGSAIVVTDKFATDHPEAVKGLLRAIVRGIRESVKDPESAIDAVLKRNEIARKDVEAERLKMVLDDNILTPWVKQNGLGDVDRERFAKALDQIGQSFKFKKKPAPEDIFTDAFLPPVGDRKF